MSSAVINTYRRCDQTVGSQILRVARPALPRGTAVAVGTSIRLASEVESGDALG